MELILIVLLVPSVYFSARFFLLYKNIKKATDDFKEICEDRESNRKLKFESPDKNFENLLKEMNNYLEEAQVDKIKFIRREKEIRKEIENMSHDLRTPLTSIRGYLELVNDEATTEEEKREYISIVERRSKGLQNLIQTFYDFSRLENNEYSMNLEMTDVNKELREQILVFYNDFENKGIDVEINLDNNPVYMDLDKNAIERVFINLIQNAIKYSKTSFKLSLYKKDEEVVLSFANDVYDLDKEECKLLFNRFYMKDASRNNQSSGLGLTITKLLVEGMGGNIEVEIEGDWIKFQVKFTELKM